MPPRAISSSARRPPTTSIPPKPRISSPATRRSTTACRVPCGPCWPGDAFKVIVAALQAGTDANPEAVAKYLKKDLKEYPGLTGKLGFNEKGDRIGDLYKVYEVDGNGGFVLQK